MFRALRKVWSHLLAVVPVEVTPSHSWPAQFVWRNNKTVIHKRDAIESESKSNHIILISFYLHYVKMLYTISIILRIEDSHYLENVSTSYDIVLSLTYDFQFKN